MTTEFCPHPPSLKQRAFLRLSCKEAFYGGAAGGGKSQALLMAALEYVHVPGYSALILRRDVQRLRLSGGLIMRSQEWLAGSEARWNARDCRWTFPTGAAPATLSFGYLKHRDDRYRYGSSEYQFIAFDELTEFLEEDYLFLFSRLRKRRDIDVPLRMRSASNPGGRGHDWVLQRFISDEAASAIAQGSQAAFLFWKNGIAYVPARIADNPGLNAEEYRDSLSHLAPIDRERLMNGDWTVREHSLIKPEELKRYARNDRRLELLDDQRRVFASFDERDCYRFVTIDPAGTAAEVADEARGRHAWSVLQVWEQPERRHAHYLLLRHVIRERVGFNDLRRLIERCCAEWRPQRMFIEAEKLGGAITELDKERLPLECIGHMGKEKVVRANYFLAKLARGEIRLPAEPLPWLAALEGEWLRWTGHPQEVSDQIDAAAYAARVAEERRHQVIRIPA